MNLFLNRVVSGPTFFNESVPVIDVENDTKSCPLNCVKVSVSIYPSDFKLSHIVGVRVHSLSLPVHIVAVHVHYLS